MHNKFFIILTTLFIFSSCEFQKYSTSDYDIPEDTKIKVYSFDLYEQDSILRYSEVYSKVDYIPLETTDESLIAEITKLEVLENGELLIFDYTKGAILLFDRNGKFLRHIGHKGKGHDEYISPKLMAYDRYSKQVVVFDSSTSNLLFYNIKGELISSIDINMYISDLSVLDKEHLCVYMNYCEDFSKKQKGYNVKVINRNGLIISEYKEYGAEMQLFHPACGHIFPQINEKTYFVQPYSYLVSTIKSNGIQAAFYLDFGEHRIPREWIPGDDMDIVWKVESSKEIVDPNSLFFMRDKVVMVLLRATRCSLYFLDIKNRDNDKYAGYGMINDLCGLETSQDLKAVHGDKLYFSIMPAQFISCQSWISKFNIGDNLSEKQKNYYETEYKLATNKCDKAYYKKYMESTIVLTQKDLDIVHSVREEDNPIIQVCTIK